MSYEGEPSYPSYEEYSGNNRAAHRESSRVSVAPATVFAKELKRLAPAPDRNLPKIGGPVDLPPAPQPTLDLITPEPIFPELAYSPTPAPFSPTPAPYSPTPSPYSPSPASYLGPSTPLSSVTPVPIFQASPAYILGLRSPDPTIYSYDPVSLASKSLVERGAKYIPPTTWKPKYPKILEHTLRSTAAHAQRLKKHVSDEQEEEEYDYQCYD